MHSLREFPSQYQPFLARIVNSGVVGLDSAEEFIEKTFSHEDLLKLSFSEHPLLRAVALRKLLNDSTIDHRSLIFAHLSDTALISVDHGEWGFEHMTVADDMLDHAYWKTQEEKDEIVRKVISSHNNLVSAYNIASSLEPKEEYYLHLKDMIERENHFEKIERVAFLLAKYRRKKDIPVIKNILMRNSYQLGVLSFRLMEQYPDTSYLSVLEKFAKRGLARMICEQPFSNDSEHFFHALASYKNKRSAEILDKLLYRQPFVNCGRENLRPKEKIMHAIWNNPCPAYTGMRNYIKDSIAEYEKNNFPREPVIVPSFPGPGKLYWY
jgi:hypothetical protein